MRRALHLAGWSYVAVCAALVMGRPRPDAPAADPAAGPAPLPSAVGGADPADAAQWLRRVKPYCNAVEVTTLQRQTPAPTTVDGQGARAACYALAGRVDEARRVIDALPAADRLRAAGVVFDAGHPVADAGDDRSAGPIMELVVDYWPDHYMALYHAGMAEYMLGQHDLARQNLTAFLRHYAPADGWRTNAVEVLGRLDDSAGRGREEHRRPREPGT